MAEDRKTHGAERSGDEITVAVEDRDVLDGPEN
jgi:hypothetical protein